MHQAALGILMDSEGCSLSFHLNGHTSDPLRDKERPEAACQHTGGWLGSMEVFLFQAVTYQDINSAQTTTTCRIKQLQLFVLCPPFVMASKQ